MMQMLSAGGMPVLTDDVRQPDEDNPRGYFGVGPVKRTKAGPVWFTDAEGKAVKMVYLLLRDLPSAYAYRVIMMRRDVEEVLASQRNMLQRSGRAGAGVTDERMAQIFSAQIESVLGWLAAQPNFTVLEVAHSACLADPIKAAAQVNHFLGGYLNEHAMAAVINPALYRNRGNAG